MRGDCSASVSYTHLDVYKRQLLYLLSHKQVKLLIQAFKRNGFREINNLFNMKYVFLIVFFMILIAIRLMR